jgi:methionyl-tRNA formyltransferase
MTAGELHDTLMETGAGLMVEALAELERGEMTLVPQAPVGLTYAKKIDKTEARIDWSLPAKDVHNHVRGLSPFPGAWSEIEAGGKTERLKLLRSTLADGNGNPGEIIDGQLTVACGNGAVRLVGVQRAGGRPASAQEFLRGTKLEKGMRLS